MEREKNERLFSLGDKVTTPHGVGTIVNIESWTANHDTCNWDDPKAYNWRYGVFHVVKSSLRYNPAYYFARELEKA